MDFPKFVPVAVQRMFIAYLVGEPERDIQGYVTQLEIATTELSRIESAIASKSRIGEEDYLPSLWDQQAKARERKASLAKDVSILQRLAYDARMYQVYETLTKEGFDDNELKGFVRAAWVASMDYQAYRSRHKRAKELSAEISKAADALKELIDKFSSTGVHGPDDFYSIRTLLRQADNHEIDDRNLHMWRSMREYILGEKRRPHESLSSEEMELRNVLGYAWGTAPNFTALLSVLSSSAKQYKPEETGSIGAALNSRKRNPTTAFVRAYAAILQDREKLTLTPPVKHAMASIANVALNDEDSKVDAAYVTSALANASSTAEPR